MQMVIQDHLTYLGQRGLSRLDLFDHVDAVSILLDHRRDAVHMPSNALQPVDRRGSILGLQMAFLIPSPWGWGISRV